MEQVCFYPAGVLQGMFNLVNKQHNIDTIAAVAAAVVVVVHSCWMCPVQIHWQRQAEGDHSDWR